MMNDLSAEGTGFGGIHSDFQFTLVECTTNAHCAPGSGSNNADAVSAKSVCNLNPSITYTGYSDKNYFNIGVDYTPPTGQ